MDNLSMIYVFFLPNLYKLTKRLEFYFSRKFGYFVDFSFCK